MIVGATAEVQLFSSEASDYVFFASLLYVALVEKQEKIAAASVSGHALVCEVDEISLLSGAGKGVTLMKLQGEDRLIGASLLGPGHPYLVLEHDSGKTFDIGVRGGHVVARGGKGLLLFKRGNLVKAEKPALVLPTLGEDDGTAGNA